MILPELIFKFIMTPSLSFEAETLLLPPMIKEFSRTFKIALPLIISNISQIGLGLIDSAMIGAVDYRQLAASSLVLNVISIPQVLGMGMAIAVSPMTAIANGQKDALKASK